MATNTHLPYLQTTINPSIMYDDNIVGNDFMGNTLNTPDIVDMLDSFHPTFQSEKTYNNDHQIFTDVYAQQIDGSTVAVAPSSTSTTTAAAAAAMLTNINPMIINSSSYSSSSSSLLYNYVDSPQQQQQQQNYYERKSYSPLLESSEINLENMSSPEMAPVSPNKVCPQSDYNYPQPPPPPPPLQQQQQQQQQQYSDSSNSSNNSNNNNIQSMAYQNLESAQPIIKDEFDEMSSLVDYLSDQSQSATTTATTATTNMNPTIQQQTSYYPNPNSPAGSISSNYSLDSCNSQTKTFATLDNVTNIKQEPIDSSTILIQQPQQRQQQQQQYQSIVPTVVNETIVSETFVPSGHNHHHHHQHHVDQNTTTDLQSNQIIYNLTPVTSNNNGSTTATSTTNYYYMSPVSLPTANNTNSINSHTNHLTAPSTSNQMQQQQQHQHHGRKRTANFNGVSHPSTSTNGTKKQRMSKREKQKLMESYIEQYERENKQLAGQIELFEKQINFCKKYLSENVAPYIQKQQQQQQPIHQQLQSFIGLA
nr:putative uncharacterized protein DDB_G0271606 [Dermatophagoides farinae]